jgi:curli production assembly/transport component CsgG
MSTIKGLSECRKAAALLCVMALAGCGAMAQHQLSEGMMPPVLNPVTELNQELRSLPSPNRKVVVAVYNYADQTGQFKPADGAQNLSRAVTQGATSVIIKALQDTGNGSWFTVLEREKLDNLLKERRIIADMRKIYLGEEQINPQALPPLLFAGILLEGGIIGYDTNLQTGGIGARLLGIGGDIKYRLDTITVYLRAVSTKNGQVLASVVTHKTIASIGLQGGVFKFIAIDKILEGEAGFTKNEPEQFAVQQAIEKAVHAMVIEGAEQGIWSFADKSYQNRAIEQYRSQLFSSREQGAAKTQTANAGTPPTPQAPQTQTAQAPAKEDGKPKPAAKSFETAVVPNAANAKAAPSKPQRKKTAEKPAAEGDAGKAVAERSHTPDAIVAAKPADASTSGELAAVIPTRQTVTLQGIPAEGAY